MFYRNKGLDGFQTSLEHIEQARMQLKLGDADVAWKHAGVAQHEAAKLPFLLRRRVIESIYDLPWPERHGNDDRRKQCETWH